MALLSFMHEHRYGVFTAVIDKKAYYAGDGKSSPHPYHLGLAAMLNAYCGFLDYCNCEGDVMFEVRGKAEDAGLQSAYSSIYAGGTLLHKASLFQRTLTSNELKLSSVRQVAQK